MESFNIGTLTKNGRDQTKCPFYRGVCLIEVFDKTEFIVVIL